MQAALNRIPTRRILLIGIALDILFLILLLVSPSAQSIQDTKGDATVQFAVSHRWVLGADSCVTVQWQVGFIQAVFLNGEGRVGEGEEDTCMNRLNRLKNTLRVQFTDDSVQEYTLYVDFITQSPVLWILLIAGILLILALYWGIGHPYLAHLVLILIPTLFLIVTALAGADFGNHWDEYVSMDGARNIWSTGDILQKFYGYPSMWQWLTLLAYLPDRLLGTQPFPGGDTADYILTARSIFIFVTAATIPLTYIATFLVTNKRWLAFFGATILAVSWEVVYHSRFVVPDGIVMFYASASLLFAVLAVVRPHDRRWWWLTVIACAFVFSTKYNSLFIGMNVLIVTFVQWQHRGASWREFVLDFLKAAVLGGIILLLITPGITLDMQEFLDDMQRITTKYAGGQRNYTVGKGIEHILLVIQYFVVAFFSHFPPIALSFAALIPVGCYALWRQNRNLLLLGLAFPIAHLLFMSTQSIMVVRQYLPIAPYLAFLAAIGLGMIWSWISKNRVKMVLALMLLGSVLINAAWIIHNAGLIQQHTGKIAYSLTELLDFVEERPDETFCFAPHVVELLGQGQVTLPENVVAGDDDVDYLVYEAWDKDEGTGSFIRQEVLVNRPNIVVATFGTYAANMDYYVSWADWHISILRGSEIAEGRVMAEVCTLG